MFPLLLSPLLTAVTSVASGAGSLAVGAVKTAAKAVSATGDAIEDSGTVTDKKGKKWDADSPQGKTVAAAQAKAEEEAEPKDLFGGLDLAKVKSAIDAKPEITPEEEEPKTVYKQMIKQLQIISSTLLRMEETLKMMLSIEYERIQGMVQQDRDTTLKQGDTDTDSTEKGRGILGRGKDMLGGAYGKVKDKLTGSTFGKLLGLGALIIAFKKYPEEIKLALEKVLKYFSDVYSVFKEEGFGEALKKVVDDFQNIAYPKIKEVVLGILDSLWSMIKGAAMEWLFGASGDKVIKQQADTGAQSKQNAAAIASKMTGDAKFSTYDDKITGAEGLTKKETTFLGGEVASTLAAMKKISKESDGRIAWTGMNDLTELVQGGILRSYTPSQVLNANPVIDGVEYPDWEVLKNINLNRMGGITRTMTDEKQKEIKELLAEKTRLYQDFAEWSRATVGDEPGWQWINDMKGDAKFPDRKANRLTAIQGQIDINEQALRHSGRIADMPDMTGSYKVDTAGTTSAQTNLNVTGTNRWTPASGGTVNVTTVAPVDASTKLVSQETTQLALQAKNIEFTQYQLARLNNGLAVSGF